MYIKKILWAIALIGLAAFAYIAYNIYGAMFSPNTNFEEDSKIIYISNDDSYTQVRNQLIPILEDIGGFDALARQKKYTANVKPGKLKKE